MKRKLSSLESPDKSRAKNTRVLSNPNTKKSLCGYRLPDSDSSEEYQCEHEPVTYYKPVCIFHIEKPDINSLNVSEKLKAEEIENQFRSRLDEIILNAESSDSEFIDFRGFQFPTINFLDAFSRKVDFSYAVFNNDVNFSVEIENPNPEHKYDTHRYLMLSKGAYFRKAIFKGIATFNYLQIFEEIDFQGALFENSAFFNSIHCDKSVNFENLIFNGVAEFVHAHFCYVDFSNTVFSQKVDFTYIQIVSSTSFYNTVFNQEVDFSFARFGKETDDKNEVSTENENDDEDVENIKGHTTFMGAIFNEKVSFDSAVFFCSAEFYDVTFRKQIKFISYDESHPEIERTGMFHDIFNFIRITLPKDEECIFFRTILSKARFHDTNLEKIIFRDVEWAKAKTIFQKLFRGKAYLLWDEIRPLEGMRDWLDDAKTAENYRQLVLNYESKRDYESAEYFHIGEMEMRRKRLEETDRLSLVLNNFYYSRRHSEFWFKYRLYELFRPFEWLSRLTKKFNGYGLYFLSSRYGTSYAQAFLILVIQILIFSFLFLFSGIKTSKEVNTNNAQIIEYNLLPSLNHSPVSTAKFLSDYREAVSYTLSIITFQKERFYEPLDWQARYLLYFAVFILTAQSALVLLAVRRQFKR